MSLFPRTRETELLARLRTETEARGRVEARRVKKRDGGKDVEKIEFQSGEFELSVHPPAASVRPNQHARQASLLASPIQSYASMLIAFPAHPVPDSYRLNSINVTRLYGQSRSSVHSV